MPYSCNQLVKIYKNHYLKLTQDGLMVFLMTDRLFNKSRDQMFVVNSKQDQFVLLGSLGVGTLFSLTNLLISYLNTVNANTSNQSNWLYLLNALNTLIQHGLVVLELKEYMPNIPDARYVLMSSLTWLPIVCGKHLSINTVTTKTKLPCMHYFHPICRFVLGLSSTALVYTFLDNFLNQIGYLDGSVTAALLEEEKHWKVVYVLFNAIGSVFYGIRNSNLLGVCYEGNQVLENFNVGVQLYEHLILGLTVFLVFFGISNALDDDLNISNRLFMLILSGLVSVFTLLLACIDYCRSDENQSFGQLDGFAVSESMLGSTSQLFSPVAGASSQSSQAFPQTLSTNSFTEPDGDPNGSFHCFIQ